MKLSKAQKISTPAFPAVNRSSRITPEVFSYPLWPHDPGTSECCVSCSCSTWWCLWWRRAAVPSCRCWPAQSLSRFFLGILTDLCSAQTPHTTACYQVSFLVPFPILKHIPCLRKKERTGKVQWQQVLKEQLFTFFSRPAFGWVVGVK